MEFFAQRHAGDIATRVAINDQIALPEILSGGVAANALEVSSSVAFLARQWRFTIFR